jgi:hypothetical protein
MLAETWDQWFAKNRSAFDATVGHRDEPHPALLACHYINSLCAAIRRGDQAAFSLAIQFLREDPRLPFGKTLKSQIARAFKAVAVAVNSYQREQLIRYRDKLNALPFPPRELRHFESLVRTFDRIPPQ